MASRRARSAKPADERTDDEKILSEARDRFKICQDWESDFQTLCKDDTKFYHGDSDNGWQWPKDLKKDRESNKRPSLTINKTKSKVNLIVNDAFQNKPGVAIKPVGSQTSFDAAQVYEDVVRQIEYLSKAPTIYDLAMRSAVIGGIGWWRVGTYYPEVDSFDQEINITPVRNQLGVYLDPNIHQADGSDAKYGFVFDEIPKDEAERLYPDADLTDMPTVTGPETWLMGDNVRTAEYYRIVEKKDELIYVKDNQDNDATFLKSEMPGKKAFKDLLDKAEQDGGTVKRRPVMTKSLEWYKIIGDAIIKRQTYKYQYIPLIRVVGIEDVVDGKLVRYGHVRALKDPQRMYNYNSSGQVEFGALATKVPWVGPKAAFAGNEDQWNRANTQNFAYLTYNHLDPDNEGVAIPPPSRPEPPGASPAFLQGMQVAEHEMDMASGQFEASDGRQGNERSGVAIAERQRQGDTATYHFINSQAIAIRYTGAVILDMFPHVYDTERVIQIMGRDGVQSHVTLNPDMEQAIEKKREDDVVKIMFNPKIGKYMVQADVGPSYATARQEAWNAFVQLVGANGELYNEIGDLMFRSADFPLADKIADRLMRKIRTEKPYLFDDEAPTPQQQALQQQVQELSKEVEQLLQSLAKKDLKLVGKEQMRDIDAYKAETDRIGTLANAEPETDRMGIVGPLAQLILKTIAQANGVDLTDLIQHLGNEGAGESPPAMAGLDDQAAAQGGDDAAPVPGAQQAPDGNWYVSDPNRPGGHMLVQ